MKDKKTQRTSEGLRSVLFEALDDFINGKIDHIHAKTVARVSDVILKSVAIDIEHKKLIRDLGKKVENGDKCVANLNLNVMLTPSIINKEDQ